MTNLPNLMVHNVGVEAVFNFKKAVQGPFFPVYVSFRSVFVSFLPRFLRKMSSLIAMELSNEKVVGGSSVAKLSNRRRENSL